MGRRVGVRDVTSHGPAWACLLAFLGPRRVGVNTQTRMQVLGIPVGSWYMVATDPPTTLLPLKGSLSSLALHGTTCLCEGSLSLSLDGWCWPGRYRM